MLATVVVRLAAERLRVNPKKPLTIKRVLPLFCEGFLDLSENDTQLEVSLDATKLDYEAIEQITPVRARSSIGSLMQSTNRTRLYRPISRQ